MNLKARSEQFPFLHCVFSDGFFIEVSAVLRLSKFMIEQLVMCWGAYYTPSPVFSISFRGRNHLCLFSTRMPIYLHKVESLYFVEYL